jgi:hypothetical protein
VRYACTHQQCHQRPPDPAQDHHSKPKKDIPYTGWDSPVPSKDGGEGEPDFLNKPPYHWSSDAFVPKYRSECWCGAVAFELHGDPLDAKHCHCRQCQRLHGAPFQWAVLFAKTACRIVKNENNALHFFSTQTFVPPLPCALTLTACRRKNDRHHVPCKVSCNQCRAPLFDEGRAMVLVYPSTIRFEDDQVPRDFQPTAHIFYAERVMDVADGVPKWAGHKGDSELLEEIDFSRDGSVLLTRTDIHQLTNVLYSTMPKYKGPQEN